MQQYTDLQKTLLKCIAQLEKTGEKLKHKKGKTYIDTIVFHVQTKQIDALVKKLKETFFTPQ